MAVNDMLLYENVPSIERNFPVKIEYEKGNNLLRPHWHEHLELLLFVGDGCNFCCNGENVKVSKNDFIVVNSNEIHSFSAEGAVEHFYILIWPKFFEDIDFENIIIETHIKKDSFIKECVLNMYNEYKQKKAGYDMHIKAYAYMLTGYLMRNYKKERLTENDIIQKRTKIKRLDKIFEYISENYRGNITTAQIAKMCYLNESYLCRFFKKATGITLLSYINEYRIEKAAVLLRNTEENITNVALNAGFSDLNYFSRIFKKNMGCSPKEYRKNKQS